MGGYNCAVIVLLHTLAQVVHTCAFKWCNTTLSEGNILQSQWLCVIDPQGFLDSGNFGKQWSKVTCNSVKQLGLIGRNKVNKERKIPERNCK